MSESCSKLETMAQHTLTPEVRRKIEEWQAGAIRSGVTVTAGGTASQTTTDTGQPNESSSVAMTAPYSQESTAVTTASDLNPKPVPRWNQSSGGVTRTATINSQKPVPLCAKPIRDRSSLGVNIVGRSQSHAVTKQMEGRESPSRESPKLRRAAAQSMMVKNNTHVVREHSPALRHVDQSSSRATSVKLPARTIDQSVDSESTDTEQSKWKRPKTKPRPSELESKSASSNIFTQGLIDVTERYAQLSGGKGVPPPGSIKPVLADIAESRCLNAEVPPTSVSRPEPRVRKSLETQGNVNVNSNLIDNQNELPLRKYETFNNKDDNIAIHKDSIQGHSRLSKIVPPAALTEKPKPIPSGPKPVLPAFKPSSSSGVGPSLLNVARTSLHRVSPDSEELQTEKPISIGTLTELTVNLSNTVCALNSADRRHTSNFLVISEQVQSFHRACSGYVESLPPHGKFQFVEMLSLLTGVAEGLKTGNAREYERLLVTLQGSLKDIENALKR